MNKKLIAIILFLIAGIYLDIRIKSPWSEKLISVCNGPYSQRAFIVQTIIPFKPERETFYFGYSNKHWDLTREDSFYVCVKDDPTEDSDVLKVHRLFGCAYQHFKYPERQMEFGSHAHFIDLLFWRKPIFDQPILEIDLRYVDDLDYYREIYQ